MESRRNLFDFFALKNSRIKPRITEQTFAVQMQMPVKQINHYLDQAITKNQTITLQTNPTKNYAAFSEFSGKPLVLEKTDQLLIQTENETMTFLVQPQHIRHIRLAQ